MFLRLPLLVPAVLAAGVPLFSVAAPSTIDRQALVTRHNVVRDSVDALVFEPSGAHGSPHAAPAEPRYVPLQVGNGQFAFSVDVTGLQTFIPCQTFAHWGWHTEQPPAGLSPDAFEWIDFPSADGRRVPYSWVGLSPNEAYADAEVPMSDEQQKLAFWIRANPHLLNLGRVSMVLLHDDGRQARLDELRDVHQVLDLWSGIITSRFTFDGEQVEVLTRAHPERDAIGITVTSSLVAAGRLRVSWKFPYGDTRKQTADVGNWSADDRHRTRLESLGDRSARFHREVDATRYAMDLHWSTDATVDGDAATHTFTLRPAAAQPVMDFVMEFSAEPQASPTPLDAAAVHAASVAHWPRFWKSGAAIDLSGTRDPRADELERRIVLSQYLMAVQEAGDWPPQEAGLVNLGWHGKFHLEMVPWHLAHYALWDRWEMPQEALGMYARFLPEARALAKKQGYPGARWPKMVGPDGRQSPGNVNPFLVWQQPHPMLFAELDWRANPTRETLEKWREILFATADFMAALPAPRDSDDHLHLGPPLKTVSENAPAASTWDPAFELSYWRFGLRIAQTWRERLGLPRERRWDDVARKLAPLPEVDGRYVLSDTQRDTYENWHWEHPAVVGILGILPGDGADANRMKATFDAVVDTWDFARVWGWDFPMLAMCAARVGEPERAIDMLLHESPNFQFADSGLATGGPWPYFPSNGALLYAVALMAGGWDGAPDRPAPGFPESWVVRAEGFKRAP